MALSIRRRVFPRAFQMHFLSTEAKQTPETQKPKQFTKPPPTMFSYLHTPDLDRKRLIDSMIRVDQAGERGAISILNGQLAVFAGSSIGKTIQDMKDNELEHQEKMNQLLVERRVRPTILTPFWDVAGFTLGLSTALMGKEAAMACTAAVEEVIGQHYNDQVRVLLENEYNDDEELREVLKKHRDDEIGHKDTAIANNAEQAPAYQLLSGLIKAGCHAAIWISARV